MAAGGDIKFSCCSSCLDDGRNNIARHYCVDCEMYFCTKCVKYHNKMPALKTHHVNDVNSTEFSDADDDTTSLKNEVPCSSIHSLRCVFHQGKLVDTYCKDHDEVCCVACAVVKHRSCSTVLIDVAAKNFKSSPDMYKFKEALTENLTQCKQERDKRTDNNECISKQKLELIKNVDKYEEKIIAKIKELANISRNEILSRYEEHKAVLDTDIEALDVVIATNTDCVDKLEQLDDEQLFVLVKTCPTITKDGESLIRAMTKDWKERVILFCYDERFEKYVFGINSLGRLDDQEIEYQAKFKSNVDVTQVTEYQAKFQSSVDVTQKHDTGAAVVDMCFIGSNDLLLTDHQNRKLKRLNSYLQFKDEIVLSGYPVAVCKIDEHEVAVRIYSTKVVHIVSVGQRMQLTSSFTLENDGWGMAYNDGTGEIYACENTKVSVYSKTGDKLRSYEKDTNGEPMFSQCRQIAFSDNKQDIYVTDSNNGLFVLNKSGTLKMKVSLSDISDAWPLCLLPGDIILTGSFRSGVIVQVDKDGKQKGFFIDTTNDRTETCCAVYDREHSSLLVGGRPCRISVYNMSGK